MPAEIPKIPAWLIEQVVESLPINAYPHRDVHQAIQVRRAIGTSLAVQVWHLALGAGATWGMSIASGMKYMVVTAEQMEKIQNDMKIKAADDA